MKFKHIPLMLGMMLMASPSFGQLTYVESVNGDLSDSGPAPTSLGVFGPGVSTITGSLGATTGGSGATNGNDADIFTFTLGAGQSVTSISTTRQGPTGSSFIGYSNSNSLSVVNSNATLGAATPTNGLFNNGTPGGVPTTLGAGDHTFFIQETNAGPVDYSISFNVVSAIPEPSSAALLSGLAMVGFIRRRRR